MAWNHNDPDPLESRRRQLAEQERALAEQRRRLTEQLQSSSETASRPVARAEPLLWRNEDDGPPVRTTEPAPTRKRDLARQTQRDKVFVIFLIVLVLVVGVLLWIAYLHNITSTSGA